MTQQTVTGEQVEQMVRFTTFSASRHHMKLTADEQRSIFGKAIFRMAAKVTKTGIQLRKVADFGRDAEYQDFTWNQVARAINEGRKLTVR